MKTEKQIPKQTQKDVELTPEAKQDGFNILKEIAKILDSRTSFGRQDPDVMRLYATIKCERPDLIAMMAERRDKIWPSV